MSELRPKPSPAGTVSDQKNHASRWVLAVLLLLILGGVFAFSHRPSAPEAKPGHGGKHPVPVVLTPVASQTVPVEIKTIGNVESISSVTLKPQIDGVITRIGFQEGDQVQQGQLLFTINAEPVEAAIAQAVATVAKDQALVAQARAQLAKDQAAVDQAVATLKRDQAQLVFAKGQEKRYASLLAQQFISQSEYDQNLATSRSAVQTVKADRASWANAKAILDADAAAIQSALANVKADQAMVESNRIKLAYCFIRAPFSGRTGSLKVHVGDTMQNGVTAMVVLDKLDPINVGFSIPEQSTNAVRSLNSAQPFAVSVITRETPPRTLSGTLKFMENTVDVTTGTLRLKATFPNATHHLWPGQFVDVALQLAREENALVIPSQAVQSGQKGDYVFVNRHHTAQLQPVVVDRVVNDMAVIRSGLNLGDAVVTDGQFQLTPGSPIREAGHGKSGAAQPDAQNAPSPDARNGRP
jgi:multidrug efflux system membrane fusion protein